MYLGDAGLIGPFTEREGCPEGSVVAHRYGGTFNNPQRMVQCRLLPQAPAASPPPPPPAPAPVVNVSPVVQTEVSPQISPVFQQTGSGDQSAGTAQIAPGGQSATGSGGQDMTAFLQYMQAEDRRRREEQQQRDREAQLQREREAELERQRRVAEENRILATQEADRAAALRLEQERQAQFAQAQAEMQSREEARAEEVAAMAEQMRQAAQAAQANTGGGSSGPAFLPTLPGEAAGETQLPLTQKTETQKSVPWPLIAAGVVLLGVAGYSATSAAKKRRRRRNV